MATSKIPVLRFLRDYVDSDYSAVTESDTLKCGDYSIEIYAYHQIVDGIILPNPDVIDEPSFMATLHEARERMKSLSKIAAAKAIICIEYVGKDAEANEKHIWFLQQALNQQHYHLSDEFKRDIEKCIALLQGADISPKPKAPKIRQAKKGFIYLATNNLGDHKIGMSEKPVQRIEKMGIKLPFPLDVVHLIETNDMRAAESALHDRFSTKRIKGEWFKLSEEDIQAICAISEMMFEVEL
jgi:hypothetical protein